MHIARLIIITVIAVVIDQISKYYVLNGMYRGQSIPVLDGLLNLTFVMNPGAAFGFLSGASEKFRVPFFLVISLVAIGVVIFFYLHTARDNKLLQVGLALILGGAIGNLIDRVRFSEVVDFIDFYFKGYHWPAFNVADSAITIGVSLLVLEAIISGRQQKKERP